MNEDDPNIKSAEKLKTIEEQGRLCFLLGAKSARRQRVNNS
tara:strand:- start:711 stop:833 length:123 start_codon:yes stop_codon:yes gene_type:complete